MLRNLDVERVVLIVMVALILGGVGFIMYQRSAAEELSRAMSGAERNLSQIGVLTDEVLLLQEELAEDEVASGTAPFAYIETQMVATRIGKTSFSIAPPQEDRNESDGYIDTKFRLTTAAQLAAQGRDEFTREDLATFLLFIEGKTTRMKVTSIKLDRSMRSGAGTDAWKPRFTITDRRPIGQG
ncbi:MAG: hypothetical protein ACYTG2_09940 [Planctomycetota bacterium]|jgi:hypothetical protein